MHLIPNSNTGIAFSYAGILYSMYRMSFSYTGIVCSMYGMNFFYAGIIFSNTGMTNSFIGILRSNIEISCSNDDSHDRVNHAVKVSISQNPTPDFSLASKINTFSFSYKLGSLSTAILQSATACL